MEKERALDPCLTLPDRLVLQRLLQDHQPNGVEGRNNGQEYPTPDSGYESQELEPSGNSTALKKEDEVCLDRPQGKVIITSTHRRTWT